MSDIDNIRLATERDFRAIVKFLRREIAQQPMYGLHGADVEATITEEWVARHAAPPGNEITLALDNRGKILGLFIMLHGYEDKEKIVRLFLHIIEKERMATTVGTHEVADYSFTMEFIKRVMEEISIPRGDGWIQVPPLTGCAWRTDFLDHTKWEPDTIREPAARKVRPTELLTTVNKLLGHP